MWYSILSAYLPTLHGKALASSRPGREIRVSLGVSLGAKQDRGGSQREEQHGQAAEVNKIARR
jgi:hypothetical protein